MDVGRVFGLGGLSGATQRALAVALSTSIAVVMGTQLVYPVLPRMMEQLGVDKSSIGLVITVFTLPSIFLVPFAGAIADLHGRRPLLVGGLLLFGLGGAAVGLAPDFTWVLVLRAVQGVGVAALTPLTIVLLSDLFDDERRESGAQGAKVVLDRVATALFPVLAGLLAVLSWKLPFFAYGLAVPVALLSVKWMPETRGRDAGTMRGYLGGFGVIGRTPRLLVAMSAGFIRFFLDYGYFTFLPIYLSFTHGTSSEVVGVLIGLYAAGAIVSASQAHRLMRWRDPVQLVVLGFALEGVAALGIPVLGSDALFGVAMFVYGLGNGLISPMQKSLITRNAPAEVRAGVVSLDRMLQQVAKTLGSAAMGVLVLWADVGTVFWVLGSLSLLSVAMAAVLLTRWGDVVAPRAVSTS